MNLKIVMLLADLERTGIAPLRKCSGILSVLAIPVRAASTQKRDDLRYLQLCAPIAVFCAGGFA